MTWFINFCAPFIPNDLTINLNRYFQAGALAFYTIAYTLLHLYYKFCQPQPDHDSEEEKPKNPKETAKENESEEADSEEQSSHKSKALSIKIDEHANESCVELKKTGTTWYMTQKKESQKGNGHVTLAEVESYFPIVYGHFAIAMALSIMYTPYTEQSIASVLYILLTIPLLIVNAKRFEKSTNTVWILMVLLLVFIFTCGLLEVGQSNWDYLNLTCFATEYVSIYN